MSDGTARGGLAIAAVAAVVAGWCLAVARVWPGDPVLLVEIGGAAALTGWSVTWLREVLRGRRLATALRARTRDVTIDGIACHVVARGGEHAFVLGAVRPRIFLGDGLVRLLAADELRAVVLHEEHHRRTRAPARSAALSAWLPILGLWATGRAALNDRLSDLEREADAWAIRAGATPDGLARALVKSDGWWPTGAGFGAASDRRLRSLLAHASGIPDDTRARLPYEWLAPGALAAVTLTCHAVALAPLA